MWIRSTQQIAESSWQITTPASSHLLLVSGKSALLDSGLSATQSDLCASVRKVLGEQPLDYLVLTHSHFDHLGATALFKKEFPSLEVVLGRESLQELGLDESHDPKAEKSDSENPFESIVSLDHQVGSAWEGSAQVRAADLEEAFQERVVLADGDVLDLGSLELQLLSTPGHSSDSVAWYSPSERVLASGDSLGSYNGRDSYGCGAASSVSDYLGMLEKVDSLEVDTIVTAHTGGLKGDLCNGFCARQSQACQTLRSKFSRALESGEYFESIFPLHLENTLESGLLADGPFRSSHESFIKAQVRAFLVEISGEDGISGEEES